MAAKRFFGWRPSDALWALLFLVPAIAIYVGHFASGYADPNRKGTGFIQWDQPEYMAAAREFIDGEHAGLLFTPPSVPDYDQPPSLVQLHLWGLSVAWRITGWDPAALFLIYGFFFAFLTVLLCMKVLDGVVPLTGWRRRLGQLLFLWGGGLISAGGMVAAWFEGYRGADLFKHSYLIDPASGWWVMNLGRNLMLPNQAFYHAMFFLALLCAMRRRLLATLIVVNILMWCHPFSGVSLMLAMLFWSWFEWLILRDERMPRWFPIVLAITAVPYLWYLFIWVQANGDPEVVRTMRLGFNIEWYSSVCAYAILFLVVTLRVRAESFHAVFRNAHDPRMFALLGCVYLVLENHEKIGIEPHQPAHFCAGYVWTMLYLIGAPWLLPKLVNAFGASLKSRVIALVVCGMLLFDNLMFFSSATSSQSKALYQGEWVSDDGMAVLRELERTGVKRVLLVCEDQHLAKLANVYTPLRCWAGHFNDGFERDRRLPAQQDYFRGVMSNERLAGRLMVISYVSNAAFKPLGKAREIYANNTYRLWEVTEGPGMP